jgi:hypothetical protein
MIKTVIISNVHQEGDFVKIHGIIYRVILTKRAYDSHSNEVVIRKVA